MNINYYKPLVKFDFANSLWYDKTSHDETFYHLISFQIRQKHNMNAVLIVLFNLSFIFTSLFISDVIEKLVKNDD